MIRIFIFIIIMIILEINNVKAEGIREKIFFYMFSIFIIIIAGAHLIFGDKMLLSKLLI